MRRSFYIVSNTPPIRVLIALGAQGIASLKQGLVNRTWDHTAKSKQAAQDSSLVMPLTVIGASF